MPAQRNKLKAGKSINFKKDGPMKSIKQISLMSALLLSAASATEATVIANFNVVETDTFAISPVVSIESASGSGFGTATLDDSGLLTLHLTDTSTIYWGGTYSYIYTTTAETVMSGIWDGSAFTPNLGKPNWISCIDFGNNPNACSALYPDSSGTATFISVGGTLTTGGGTLTSQLSQVAGIQITNSTYVLTPSVPLPAAAWLFSSGMLGLVGLKRRQSTVS
jgi:hypothetical protein